MKFAVAEWEAPCFGNLRELKNMSDFDQSTGFRTILFQQKLMVEKSSNKNSMGNSISWKLGIPLAAGSLFAYAACCPAQKNEETWNVEKQNLERVMTQNLTRFHSNPTWSQVWTKHDKVLNRQNRCSSFFSCSAMPASGAECLTDKICKIMPKEFVQKSFLGHANGQLKVIYPIHVSRADQTVILLKYGFVL